MDLHFACESACFELQKGDVFWEAPGESLQSPFYLRGLSCAKVEDRYGPPHEWEFLSLAHIWTIERLPLRTTVRVVSDVEWASEIGVTCGVDRHMEWMDELLAASEELAGDHSAGRCFDGALAAHPGINAASPPSDALSAAFSTRLSLAQAKVFCNPPTTGDPDLRFRDGTEDAHLQITLRLDETGRREWDRLWLPALSGRLPACKIVLRGLRFSESVRNAAFSGLPTWSHFVSGEFEMPSSHFEMTVKASWTDLNFDT
jgi:hypothetical protein